MNVFGIENVENADDDRPLLLVANHRSFFDLYTVSSVIFRRSRRPVKLFFPVRAKFFYDSPLGWFVNFAMGWLSMYPPFFREARDARKREFDKYSMRRLVQICSEGRGTYYRVSSRGKAKSQRWRIRLLARPAWSRESNLCGSTTGDSGLYRRPRERSPATDHGELDGRPQGADMVRRAGRSYRLLRKGRPSTHSQRNR